MGGERGEGSSYKICVSYRPHLVLDEEIIIFFFFRILRSSSNVNEFPGRLSAYGLLLTLH